MPHKPDPNTTKLIITYLSPHQLLPYFLKSNLPLTTKFNYDLSPHIIDISSQNIPLHNHVSYISLEEFDIIFNHLSNIRITAVTIIQFKEHTLEQMFKILRLTNKYKFIKSITLFSNSNLFKKINVSILSTCYSLQTFTATNYRLTSDDYINLPRLQKLKLTNCNCSYILCAPFLKYTLLLNSQFYNNLPSQNAKTVATNDFSNVKHHKNITHLHIYNPPHAAAIISLLPTPTRLQHISLTRCHNKYTNLQGMKTITLTSCFNLTDILVCQKLTKITLNKCNLIHNLNFLTTCINLTSIQMIECRKLCIDINVLEICFKLSNISIENCFEIKNIDSLKKFEKLTNLNISMPENNNELNTITLLSCPNLQSIKLHYVRLLNIDALSKLTHLTSIQLLLRRNFSIPANTNFINHLTNLTHVTLEDIYTTNIQPLLHPKLKYINLVRWYNLKNIEGFKCESLKISECPNLNKIIVGHEQSIIIRACNIKTIRFNHSNTRSLTIHKCGNLRIIHGITLCQNLEFIKLHHCNNLIAITNLNTCPKLKCIYFLNCPKLTGMQFITQTTFLDKQITSCPNIYHNTTKWNLIRNAGLNIINHFV